MLSSSEEEEDDDDLDDKFMIDPLDRHLKVPAEGVFADKIKKVQDQAQRTADEVLRFRERRAKKEAELEVVSLINTIALYRAVVVFISPKSPTARFLRLAKKRKRTIFEMLSKS